MPSLQGAGSSPALAPYVHAAYGCMHRAPEQARLLEYAKGTEAASLP